MALLLSADALAKSYGPRTLFTGVALSLFDQQRVGLIGPNGSGKSTLLKILAGLETPDEGLLSARSDAVIAYLPQEDQFAPGFTVEQVVRGALDEHHDATNQHHIEPHERNTQTAITLTQLGFTDLAQVADTLSGGWRKRLALARELAKDPDLLLLDEPTNHLDLEGIRWLEQLLANARFASLIVTHDRYLLENVATRVVELSRAYPNGSFGVDGPYSIFLEKREEFLAGQQSRQAAVASAVRREIAWLRRGAKARTTKAKGRIESAGEKMSELAELKTRNSQNRAAQIDFASAGRQTRKLIAVKDVSKSLGGRLLFSHLTFTLSPGTRLGLLGPNGSGKTTLIRLLTGQLLPDTGQIDRADALRLVVFDQERRQLDKSHTLRRALAPQGDTVFYNGSAIHVSSWAKRFLFRIEQLDLPISELSGGEQARVLIAQLMLQPADVLILDEPTNDLDIPTLEVLEESLEDFAGALVLVTHDRFMLERLSTDLLGLDGFGGSGLYGDLSQWERARQQRLAREKESTAAPKASPRPRTAPPPGLRRLTYLEQREWEQIENNILAAEEQVETFRRQMEDPKVLADHQQLTELCRQMESAQRRVAGLYARWEQLDAKQRA